MSSPGCSCSGGPVKVLTPSPYSSSLSYGTSSFSGSSSSELDSDTSTPWFRIVGILDALGNKHLSLHKQILDKNFHAEHQIEVLRLKSTKVRSREEPKHRSPEKEPRVMEGLQEFYRILSVSLQEEKSLQGFILYGPPQLRKIAHLKGQLSKKLTETQKLFEETNQLRSQGLKDQFFNESITDQEVIKRHESELSQFEKSTASGLGECSRFITDILTVAGLHIKD